MSTLTVPFPVRITLDRMAKLIKSNPRFLLREQRGGHTGAGYDLVAGHMHGFDDQFEFEIEFKPGHAPSTYRVPRSDVADLSKQYEPTTADVLGKFIYEQVDVYVSHAVMPSDPGVVEYFDAKGVTPNDGFIYRLLLLRYEKVVR